MVQPEFLAALVTLFLTRRAKFRGFQTKKSTIWFIHQTQSSQSIYTVAEAPSSVSVLLDGDRGNGPGLATIIGN